MAKRPPCCFESVKGFDSAPGWRRTGWAKLTVEFRIRDRSSLEFGTFSVAISQNGQEIGQNLFKAFLDRLTVGLAFDLPVIRRLVGKIHARNIAKQSDTCSLMQLFSVHVRIFALCWPVGKST